MCLKKDELLGYKGCKLKHQKTTVMVLRAVYQLSLFVDGMYVVMVMQKGIVHQLFWHDSCQKNQ